MKKHNFYSLCNENGKITAKYWEGYTDGVFNYYKYQFSRSCVKWYAIHPGTGLSAGYSYNSRKECAAHANTPAMAAAIKKVLSPELFARFNDCVEEARRNNIYGGIAQ